VDEQLKYWLELAEYDLETARVMLDGSRYLYVGFMCHQVIEKTLKGFYAAKTGEMPPYTHNLRKLADLGAIYSQMDDQQKDTVDQLEPLNIEALYPSYKQSLASTLSRPFCQDHLRRTQELHQWIKLKL